MKRFLFFSGLLLLVVFCSGCGGTKSSLTPQDLANLDKLVNQQEFKIESDWAYPMISSAMMQLNDLLGPQNNMQRISLIGNVNYLEVKGDSVKAYLPYFGERHMGGGYNNKGEAIQFDQKATNLKIERIEHKNQYHITFSAKEGAESYTIILQVLANNRTIMIVNSSQRSTIRYEGSIASLKEE